MTGTATKYQFLTTPRAHQREALKRSWNQHNFALFMEGGTGKSKIVIDNAGLLYERGELDALLVTAPNGVHRNWIEQVELHLPTRIPRTVALYRSGTVGWKKILAKADGLPILLMNSEALSHPAGLDVAASFLRTYKAPMLAADESHRFKTPSARRTRNAWKLRPLSAWRRLLTGTSVSQGYHELYAQFRILDPAIIGCQTYAEFKAQYCVMVEAAGFSKLVGYQNIPNLLARIAPYVFTVTKAECLDLPPQIFMTRDVELSSEQARIYRQLRTEYLAELDSGAIIDGQLAITRLLRLQQILSGLAIGDTAQQLLPCPRLQEAMDLIEEAQHKVLVWCRFNADITRLAELLEKAKVGYARYSGLLTEPQCAKELERFHSDPACKVLLGTPRKGGIGLTLNEADTVIFYSHSFSWEDRKQATDRNHRDGQTRAVTYYDLMVPGTVDVKILTALASHQDVVNVMNTVGAYRDWLKA